MTTASCAARSAACVWSMTIGSRCPSASPAKTDKPAPASGNAAPRCEWVLTNHRGKEDPEREQGNRLVEGCGSPLWQMNGELRRYEPALFIKRHLRHFFKYLILDEVHEEKGADTAQGHAAGALAASLPQGDRPDRHLDRRLCRASPAAACSAWPRASLVQEGLGWSEATAFNERYGRIETRITERSGASGGEDNRMSRGSKSTTKSVRPGIMPMLFGTASDRQGRVPRSERGRRQSAAAGRGVHARPHG